MRSGDWRGGVTAEQCMRDFALLDSMREATLTAAGDPSANQ